MANILLVDDDKDIRDLGERLLSKAGHTVTTVKSAGEAIAFMRSLERLKNPVQLLLSDINMPDMTGFEMIRELKHAARLESVTVAFLTARRDRSDIEEAVRLGVREYIVKPLDPLLFLQKVRDLAPPFTAAERAEQTVDVPSFATASLRHAAQLNTAIEIVSLSEAGLSIISPFEFSPGSRVDLNSKIFESIGIEMPFMKALESHRLASGQIETRITFFGLAESSLSKIRAYVQQEVVRHAYTARRG